MDTAALALVRLRGSLLDLARWADEHLDDDHDRQYIAEHLSASALALALDTDAPTAPF